jgi:hypothetical protein
MRSVTLPGKFSAGNRRGPPRRDELGGDHVDHRARSSSLFLSGERGGASAVPVTPVAAPVRGVSLAGAATQNSSAVAARAVSLRSSLSR